MSLRIERVSAVKEASGSVDQASAVHGRPLALGISSPGIVDQVSGRVTSLAYNVAPEGGFDPLEEHLVDHGLAGVEFEAGQHPGAAVVQVMPKGTVK